MGCCTACQEPPLEVNLSPSLFSSSEILVKNLQIHGWSPIIIELNQDSPSRQQILDLFQRKGDYKFTYRSSESGAVGEKSIEPKESLEVQLSKVLLDNNNNNNNSLEEKWCLGLSKIAHRVCECLDLPPGTLLAPCHDPNTLDLLRIFHYHATEGPELGSSPHTDWGRLVSD